MGSDIFSDLKDWLRQLVADKRCGEITLVERAMAEIDLLRAAKSTGPIDPRCIEGLCAAERERRPHASPSLGEKRYTTVSLALDPVRVIGIEILVSRSSMRDRIRSGGSITLHRDKE